MRSACLFLVTVVILLANARPAAAVVQFYNEFAKIYLDEHPNKEFAAEMKKGTNKCYVCHVGKKRTNHNAFGDELAKLLDRKKDLKDKEKIAAAVKQVMEMHVDPNDEKSETYADRVAAGKWPVGDLESNKKEPTDAATAAK